MSHVKEEARYHLHASWLVIALSPIACVESPTYARREVASMCGCCRRFQTSACMGWLLATSLLAFATPSWTQHTQCGTCVWSQPMARCVLSFRPRAVRMRLNVACETIFEHIVTCAQFRVLPLCDQAESLFAEACSSQLVRAVGRRKSLTDAVVHFVILSLCLDC